MPTKLRWQLADRTEPQLALFDAAPRREVGVGEYRGLEFLVVHAKTILNEVPAAAGLPFRWTINAYRGCSHACTYCFARPTHAYLGLGIGEDFERKIVVKINAAELLRAETAPSRWAGESIAMGTNTDPYQHAEGKFRITRAIVAVLADLANPFTILTKSPLVLRDLDLLGGAAGRSRVRADFSIGTFDEDVWKLTEPGTPHPRQRMDAVAKLNAAGVPSGVLMGPVIPGLSDSPAQLEGVVAAAAAAGASFVAAIVLHLRPGVKQHCLGRLAETHPRLAAATSRRYRGRAYAPEEDVRRITELVASLADRYGVRGREPFRQHSATPAMPTQLSLERSAR